MTTQRSPSDLPARVCVRPATLSDDEPLARLWQLFRHELSVFSAELPRPDGTYRRDWLDAGLREPSWRAWMLAAGEHPIGFALVRALDQPVRVLNSFFLVAPARRRGLGTRLAATVVDADPGSWAIAFQDANVAAARFWPTVAAAFDPDWRLEHRAVSNHPDDPPDAWVTFTAIRPGPR